LLGCRKVHPTFENISNFPWRPSKNCQVTMKIAIKGSCEECLYTTYLDIE